MRNSTVSFASICPKQLRVSACRTAREMGALMTHFHPRSHNHRFTQPNSHRHRALGSKISKRSDDSSTGDSQCGRGSYPPIVRVRFVFHQWTAEGLVHRKMIVGLSDANTQIGTGRLAKNFDIIEGIGTNYDTMRIIVSYA